MQQNEEGQGILEEGKGNICKKEFLEHQGKLGKVQCGKMKNRSIVYRIAEIR